MTSSDQLMRTRAATRQRPGRLFEPEQELALRGVARRVIPDLDGADQGLLGLREMHAPFGVPDLTVVIGDSSLRKARLRLPVPPLLNEIDAGIVAVAGSDRPLSIEHLARRVGWQAHTVGRRLPHLLRIGALREVKSGRFVRRTALRPIGTIFAVELKIGDWKRALTQVRTYRTWADSYVLILDHISDESTTRVVRAVKADRGGLVVDGQWVVRPKCTKREPARRLWTAEHIIAASRRSKPNPRPVRNS